MSRGRTSSQGKMEDGGRTAGAIAAGPDRAVMVLDDFPANRQFQARSRALGASGERFEQASGRFGGNTPACVCPLGDDFMFCPPQSQGDPASLRHAIAGIENEGVENVAEAGWDDPNPSPRGVVFPVPSFPTARPGASQ